MPPRKIIRRKVEDANSTPSEPSVAPSYSSAVKDTSQPMPRWVIPALVVVATVLCVGYAGWKYLPASFKGATKVTAADQALDVVAMASKHILVTSSETPMVATVQDADALRAKNPVFYKEAQQGDRLIVWTDRAVLFSPTRDVVLAMITMDPVSSTPTVKKGDLTVEVRNGSSTSGLGRKAADLLKADGWNVLKVGDAKKKPVAKTSIFISTKKEMGEWPATLASSVHGGIIDDLGSEPATTADILVIIGNDYQP